MTCESMVKYCIKFANARTYIYGLYIMYCMYIVIHTTVLLMNEIVMVFALFRLLSSCSVFTKCSMNVKYRNDS
jgi:hypothetical protein